MSSISFAHRADVSLQSLENSISEHFSPGTIYDPHLEEKLRRLDDIYCNYLRTYPLGLWAPGLAVTQEMHRFTELLLPLHEIRRVLLSLHQISMRDISPWGIPLFNNVPSWLGVVPHLPENMRMVNPGKLLRLAASYQDLRMQLLFALHLPERHGERFRRYPVQAAFIRRWLNARLTGDSLCCLDAACGTGEGTYELAMLLEESGTVCPSWWVEGISRNALEIFAAARAFFPHDPQRESEYRQAIQPLVRTGALSNVRFSVGTIETVSIGAETFDLVVCNGLLGGPFLHEWRAVASAIKKLCSWLKEDGLIVVADHFHFGWRKSTPRNFIEKCLSDAGVVLVEVGEGAGGIKKAAAD